VSLDGLDTFDRYPLLFGPSPVHRLERLTQHLGGARIWAKRRTATLVSPTAASCTHTSAASLL
jgi:1-aminocyclopropane-1-carboxylate deaminase/D-cysteine desulfhydrase-like pyridoxal-dependent ACC family enzyme